MARRRLARRLDTIAERQEQIIEMLHAQNRVLRQLTALAAKGGQQPPTDRQVVEHDERGG